MIHLKKYGEVFESDQSDDLQGFILQLTGFSEFDDISVFHIGCSANFYEFSKGILEYYGVYPDDDMMDDYSNFSNIGALLQKLADFTKSESDGFTFWHGLKPRVNEELATDISSYENPYITVKELERIFTNSEEIMTKYPSGNVDDLTYLAKSLESNPELASAYSNNISLLTKILTFSSMSDKEKNAILALAKSQRFS